MKDVRLWAEIVLVVLAAVFFGLWQHSSAKMAQVEAEGKQAKEDKERIEKQYEKTFKETQDAFAVAIPTIRDNAVAEYRKRYPQRVCNTSRVPVPGTAQSNQGADGAGKECVAPEFVKDCAEDAATIGIWQRWAVKNNLRVE